MVEEVTWGMHMVTVWNLEMSQVEVEVAETIAKRVTQMTQAHCWEHTDLFRQVSVRMICVAVVW